MTEQQGEYGFEKLLETLRESSFPEAEITRITQAYVFARNAHEGQLRRSGEPYIIHPVAVAQILAEMGMDGDSICAALLHDVVEDTPVTDQQVKASFGESVEQLVDGVTKIGQIPFSASQEEQQSENIRKMFLAMSRDIRVIIIKLADR
ncbi:MAG: bifunctional (p)ppGpp synthetase/guanosine-3',5'-bis(diphosphate) 3'-pyrophosphohydrolase, partial [Clostridia bacterium]|nr:bifunctional (p)ppGpp synthetase/guanosine-3',5'-bis(diphosphate) 3'-pyrophosphohydrolase [Clostridia bacterium]